MPLERWPGWSSRRRRDETVSLDTTDSEGRPLLLLIENRDVIDPEQHVISLEREKILSEALSKLRRPFREVVILRDVEGLSYEEVAQALGLSIGTVKSRLARGRNELRGLLEGCL